MAVGATATGFESDGAWGPATLGCEPFVADGRAVGPGRVAVALGSCAFGRGSSAVGPGTTTVARGAAAPREGPLFTMGGPTSGRCCAGEPSPAPDAMPGTVLGAATGASVFVAGAAASGVSGDGVRKIYSFGCTVAPSGIATSGWGVPTEFASPTTGAEGSIVPVGDAWRGPKDVISETPPNT